MEGNGERVELQMEKIAHRVAKGYDDVTRGEIRDVKDDLKEMGGLVLTTKTNMEWVMRGIANLNKVAVGILVAVVLSGLGAVWSNL